MGKVLIVEDDALVAMVAEDHLADLGFDTVWAEKGSDALAIMAQGGLSIVLIDIGLPDMRGDDLARRVRTLTPGLPIIMASGYDSDDIKDRFADHDGVAVLTKPYSFEDLRAALAALGVDGA
jgi:DNA-binding response OmpR family regulator